MPDPGGDGGGRPKNRSIEGAGHHRPDVESTMAGRSIQKISEVEGEIQQFERAGAAPERDRFGADIHVACFEHGLSDAPHLVDGVIQLDVAHLHAGG